MTHENETKPLEERRESAKISLCPRCKNGLIRATYLPLRAAIRKACHRCGHLWDEAAERSA
jgi:uncharacterized protein (DUF983 family)